MSESNWQEQKVSDFAEILDNLRVPLSSSIRAERKGDYPYCGANGIVDYIDDWIFEGEHVLIAEDGGNFYEYSTRPITYIMNGRFWVNNHAHILRAKNGQHKFLHYSFEHKDITKYIIGSTRTKLNKSALESIKMLIPPLQEQQKIAEILSTVDEKIDVIDQQISETQALKKGLMQRLLNKGIGHTEFKDSPMGEIPKSWEVVKLEEIVTRITDGEHATPQRTKEGILLLSARNVHNNRLLLNDVDFIPIGEYSRIIKRCNPEENDILISCSGSIGRVCLVPPNIRFGLVRSVALVKVDFKKSNSHYVMYSLQSSILQKQMQTSLNQSAQPNLFLGPINKLRILSPPLLEQQKIATILSSVDSKLDVLSEKKTHYLELKQGLMQQLLTGKIRVNALINNTAMA